MAKKARMYEGNPPRKAGWSEHPASPFYLEEEGIAWRLYVAGEDELWPQLKLCANSTAPFKANYWLAWSRSGLRFLRSHDAKLLYLNRPALFHAVKSALQGESIGLL